MESRVRVLFKLVLLAVLAFAVVGGWKDWYTLSTSRNEVGQRCFTLVWNDHKMLSDLAVVKASSRDAVNALTEKSEVPGADPVANGDSAAAKTKGDPKVQALEARKHELNDELSQLQKELDKKSEAAQRDLRKQIADVDHALEKAHAGH
jgi:small-conductance mechanosensitive channel